MAGQCCFRYAGNCSTVIPSIPALPLFRLTRANACLQLLRSQTASINGSIPAGLSASRFTASDSVPSAEILGASLLLISAKASSSWLFCRLSLMTRAAYLPLSLPSLRRTVWAFITVRVITMPAADCCRCIQLASLPAQSRLRDQQQLSRGKFDRLQRATAGFTTSALDGYG